MMAHHPEGAQLAPASQGMPLAAGGLARTALALGLALGLGLALVALASDAPLAAMWVLLTGPLSSGQRLGIWIEDATVLSLLGLAVALVFRARQFSLLAEGQLYLGALGAGLVALWAGVPELLVLPLALLAAALAGFLYGLIPGAMKGYLGASELVSTLMLNVVAQRFYELVLIRYLKPEGANYAWSAHFPAAATLPALVPGTRINVAALLALAVVLLGWVLLERTTFGYELRMVGASVEAARYGGINTRRTIMLSMAVSGIAAGLAGSYLALGIHRRLTVGISAGLGFEGIVVALLARNHPLAVPLAALAYSYLRVGGAIMERTTTVSADVVRVVQAVIILLVTVQISSLGFWRRRAAG